MSLIDKSDRIVVEIIWKETQVEVETMGKQATIAQQRKLAAVLYQARIKQIITYL